MGGRGTFAAGKQVAYTYETVDYVDGIKVLLPKDTKASISLPERSNTPGTSYLSYRKDGTFDQLRVFGDDRIPTLDIDYGKHRGKKSLHVHYYKDGVRGSGNDVVVLHPGDALYERYKRYFKGVI